MSQNITTKTENTAATEVNLPAKIKGFEAVDEYVPWGLAEGLLIVLRVKFTVLTQERSRATVVLCNLGSHNKQYLYTSLGLGIALGVGVVGWWCYVSNSKKTTMEADTMRNQRPTTATVTVGAPSLLRSVLNFFGSPSQEEQDPAFAASKFVLNFEELYGPVHPRFIEASYTEALRKARAEYKFLIIYLHSSIHQDTADYCGGTLATEPVTEFIDNNFLIWGGDISVTEAYVFSNTVGATTFPFMAVLCNIDGNVQLVDHIEGYMGHEELIARLTHTLENHGAILVEAQSASEERQMDRMIREEQDLAYLESLRLDQEKERKAREEERRIQEEEERQRDEERRRMEEEEYKINRKERELERRRRELPPEPADGANIVIRLPNGSRLSRRFNLSDRIKSVYDFVDVNEPGDLEMDSYELVMHYPRKVFDDKNQTLSDAGLSSQCLLYIQNL